MLCCIFFTLHCVETKYLSGILLMHLIKFLCCAIVIVLVKVVLQKRIRKKTSPTLLINRSHCRVSVGALCSLSLTECRIWFTEIAHIVSQQRWEMRTRTGKKERWRGLGVACRSGTN